MTSALTWTREKMAKIYGAFYEDNPKLHLDERNIPENLHAIIHYAEFWGEPDDVFRENLVDNATQEVRDNLKAVVEEHYSLMEPWLTGPEADSDHPTKEYLAFSAMLIASDYI